MDYNSIWNSFLNEIEKHVTPSVYNTWFCGTVLKEINNGVVKVVVPYSQTKDWLNKNYLDIMVDNLAITTGNTYEIKLYLEDEYEEELTNNVNNDKVTNIIKEKSIINNDLEDEYISYNNLKKEYTFETFVVGESNRFAYMNALQVAEQPAKVWNPFFIYGRSGLGKTHLMHAIGNYIVENSNLKVLYITTEQFKQEFINITRKDEDKSKEENLDYVDFFRNKYRNVDVLMIDDIQFLDKAFKTQEEFANTFNTLHDANKQIIICSDKNANDIKNLEERLKTRFSWGLTVQIKPPEFELKVDIIKKKIKSDELYLNISDECIETMANYVGDDVRNIEGSIRRVQAFCAMFNIKEINDIIIKDALEDYTTNVEYSSNNIYKIQDAVAKEYKVSIDDIKGKKRTANIMMARQVAMYICRVMLDETLEEIGKEFGGKDHSTVIHSVEKIDKEVKSNSQLGKIINGIQRNLNVNSR